VANEWAPKIDFEISDKRTAIIESQVSIPDMPDIAIALEREVRSRNPNMRNIIDIIEQNSVVTGALLGTFNSPAFQKTMRRKVEITTVSQVVNLFGVEKTYQIAISSALRSIPAVNDLFRTIIDHSSEVAYACAEICDYVHGVSMEKAYLYGLFMHGGMTILAAGWPEDYEPMFNLSLSMPRTAIDKEVEKFKRFRHDHLGVDIARRWGFGKKDLHSVLAQDDLHVLLAIQEQHNLNYSRINIEPVRLLVAIGNLANVVVNELIYGVYISGEAEEEYQQAKEVLMLNDEAMRNIRLNVSSYLVGL
jgi:HD-like signal output (HDOD) protein